jgi:PD-(D/E)XK nuclease superfamily
MSSPTAKDDLRHRARLLDQVQRLDWWRGKAVHKAIENWVMPEVKAGRWPRDSRVISQAQDLARRRFLFSQAGRYRDIGRTEAGEDYCVLAPHYYGQPLDSNILDESLAIIAEALHHLLNSVNMREFLVGRQWYQWEYILDFEVEGTTVRAIPDLLMLSQSGSGLDVVDWKLATATSNYYFQVAVYALAARETGWLTKYAQVGVAGHVINLLEADPGIALQSPYMVDEAILSNTLDAIYEDVESIQSLTHGKKYDQLDIEQFEYANSTGTCAMCNWRELCVELSNESPAESLSNCESKPTQLGLPFG